MKSHFYVTGTSFVLLISAIFIACGDDKKNNGSDSPKEAVEPAEPKSIAETVTFINSLPKPLSLADFVKALPQPLNVAATDSTSSLQPANMPGSPRIFIVTNKTGRPVILSIVPGKNDLEIGEVDFDGNIVVANITFPVTATLSDKAPYQAMPSCTGSSSCHDFVSSVDLGGGVFKSTVSSNIPSDIGNISVSTLTDLNTNCKDSTDRCKTLNALFRKPAMQYWFPSTFK